MSTIIILNFITKVKRTHWSWLVVSLISLLMRSFEIYMVKFLLLLLLLLFLFWNINFFFVITAIFNRRWKLAFLKILIVKVWLLVKEFFNSWDSENILTHNPKIFDPSIYSLIWVCLRIKLLPNFIENIIIEISMNII